MEHQITKRQLSPVMPVIAFLLMIFTGSCYYDNEEYLYPNPVDCDLTNVTYSQSVAPILENNCNACHSSVSPSAGIITDNYNSLQSIISDGSFRGSINHLPGWSPMPKGGNKLNQCDLAKIDAWIDGGAPNN